MHEEEQEAPRRRRSIPIGNIIFVVLFIGAVFVWIPTVYVNLSTRAVRYELSETDIAQVPEREVAIVFGAALRKRGTEPSNYLRWRIETAVKLYEAGKVKRLLMTGDGSYYDHDEPYIMTREAVELGVPREAVDMDKFGFDTYDSCTRAGIYHDVTSAIVVTQGYHLPRAVFTCTSVGIDTIGVNAQSEGRGWSPYAIVREWLSTDKLMVQLIDRNIRE